MGIIHVVVGCAQAGSMLEALLVQLLLLLLLQQQTVDGNRGTISPTELDALHHLYDSTNGTGWNWRPRTEFGPEWNFTSTDPAPCMSGNTWQGLNCSCTSNSSTTGGGGVDCNVTELVLVDFGLVGRAAAISLIRSRRAVSGSLQD